MKKKPDNRIIVRVPNPEKTRAYLRECGGGGPRDVSRGLRKAIAKALTLDKINACFDQCFSDIDETCDYATFGCAVFDILADGVQ